jgi:dTDP-4-dehydrorhamnose reductase
MKWLITGANGMLGRDLDSELATTHETRIHTDSGSMNITDRDAVLRVVREHRPNVIANCAAFTNVDGCETDEERATLVNGGGVRNLAEAANAVGATLVHVSTDFVFDGAATEPYETDDRPAPVSAYGRSKLAGETAAASATRHLIVRTSWLFGQHGWNFVEAIRKQVNLGKSELKVVSDQRGKPTWTPHLAFAMHRLVEASRRDPAVNGIFHYADEPECTWFDFAAEIVDQLRRRGELPQEVKVNPCSTDEFPRPARRPAYSVLSTSRYEAATGERPGGWKEGLAKYLDGIKN